MGTCKFALVMLKREFKKSIGYTFVLTFSLLISFIFIAFIDNPMLIGTDVVIGGGSFSEMDIPLSKALPFIVVVICWIMILYTSDYYLNKKTDEFALVFLSGGSFIDVGKYVLFQVLVLLCLAIPPALLLGTFALQQIYIFMYSYLNIAEAYSISFSTYLNTVAALIPIMLIIGVSITGYVHRNPLQVLLGRVEEGGHVKIKKTKFVGFLYIILYIIGIVSIYLPEHSSFSYIFPSMVGALSMYGLTKKTIPKIVQLWKKRKGLEKRYAFISLSNYTNSLQGTILLTTFMLILVCALVPILVSQTNYTNEYITGIISYFFMVVLIVIGVVCKFSDNVIFRKNEFINMGSVGYIRKELLEIIYYEVITYYLTIILLPLPYILLIGSRYVQYDGLPFATLLFLVLIYIVPIILSMFITYCLYAKTVIVKGEKRV